MVLKIFQKMQKK